MTPAPMSGRTSLIGLGIGFRLASFLVGGPTVRIVLGLLGFGIRSPGIGRLGIGLFFFGGSSYCCLVLVFEIACQISLTPRHVGAENGSTVAAEFSVRRAARP